MHGGFVFGSASAVEASAKAGFMGFGANGAVKSAGTNVESDGNLETCSKASSKAKEPPEHCAGVLQIYLAPIDTPAEAKASAATPVVDKPVCPSGLRWTGTACAAVEPAKAQPAPTKVELPSAAAPAENPKGFACDGSDAKDCIAQCKAGNARSCAVLGQLVEFGVPNLIEPDKRLAERLYDLSCKAGSHFGCALLANLWTESRRYADALALATKACDAGEPAGCTTQGYMLTRGWGAEKNEALAFELYMRACKQREFVACNNAGVSVFFAKGNAKQDPPLACQMFQRACEATSIIGCPNLALCNETGVGVAKDPKKALELYSDACQKGNPFACVWGGNMVEQQNKDAASKAVAFYERACDYTQQGYCVSTSEIMTALPGQFSLDQIDRRACDGGDTRGLACYNAGLLYERGVNGVPKDLAKATRLFKKACSQFETKKACRPAGFMPK
jgi:TPR repeat protein